MIKKCVVCGSEFDAYRKNTIVCSPVCKQKRKNQTNREWNNKHNAELRKARREYMRNYYRQQKENAKIPADSWIRRYNRADELGKVLMVIRANDMTYPQAQAMRLTKPHTWETLVNETKKRMRNE